MFVKTSSIDDARLVFGVMRERDVITWTMFIGGFTQHGRGHEAYELFLRMEQDGVKPDAITYMTILNACASIGALEWGKRVHMHILEAGLESDLRVARALVHMYAKNGSIDDARQVFDGMEKCNVITWTMMIGGLADHGRGQESYELFLRMQRYGCVPNSHLYAQLGGWRLTDVTMYVTLEPCPMCAGAILQGRVSELVWGAPNSLLGADGSWIKQAFYFYSFVFVPCQFST